ELLLGVYEKALPALDAALARHLADTNPLADAPTVRVCRFARLELADLIDWGRRCVACLVDEPARAAVQPWLALLDECLAAAGWTARRPPQASRSRGGARPSPTSTTRCRGATSGSRICGTRASTRNRSSTTPRCRRGPRR